MLAAATQHSSTAEIVLVLLADNDTTGFQAVKEVDDTTATFHHPSGLVEVGHCPPATRVLLQLAPCCWAAQHLNVGPWCCCRSRPAPPRPARCPSRSRDPFARSARPSAASATKRCGPPVAAAAPSPAMVSPTRTGKPSHRPARHTAWHDPDGPAQAEPPGTGRGRG